jgi:hypothetical protein
MRSHSYYKTNKQYQTYLKSREWLARREQVIQRCNNTCERCGSFPVSEVHHLTYARIFHEELADLQGLCVYCHDYVHGKRSNDGTAEYDAILKWQAAVRLRADQAQSELKRFEDRPEVYLPSIDSPFSSPGEIMTMLRQNPILLRGGTECQIFDVRYARRKYESAVAFKVKWENEQGSCWGRIFSAEQLLNSGRLVLDTERHIWVDIESQRAVVTRYGNFE